MKREKNHAALGLEVALLRRRIQKALKELNGVDTHSAAIRAACFILEGGDDAYQREKPGRCKAREA